MNASDIIKQRQKQTLYKAYYNPTIFPGVSNGVSTLVRSSINYYPVSSIGSTISYASSVNIEYLYECEPVFTSYQLANAITACNYLCDNPSSSNTAWLPNSSMSTSPVYTSSNQILTQSANSYAPQPVICENLPFYQGTLFGAGGGVTFLSESSCNVQSSCSSHSSMITYTSWRAESSMGAQTMYTSSNQILSPSANSYAVPPIICTNPIFYQGNNFIIECNGCDGCDGCNGCDCYDDCIGCDEY